MTNVSADGIPEHGFDIAGQLFEADVKFFATQPDCELDRLMGLAADAIEVSRVPFNHPDTLHALVDVANRRELEVPGQIQKHLGAPVKLPEAISF